MMVSKFLANRQSLHKALASKRLGRKSKGFSLIELMMVLAIVALIAIFGLPFARGLIIEGAVEPTANDINKVAMKIRSNFAGHGATPYTSVNTATFANTAIGLAGALTITGSGAGATMTHSLGATGAAVTVASSSVTTDGDSFTVTLADVNKAACPGVASILNRATERMTINGTPVKEIGGTYNAGTATNACTADDTNTFVFTFR